MSQKDIAYNECITYCATECGWLSYNICMCVLHSLRALTHVTKMENMNDLCDFTDIYTKNTVFFNPFKNTVSNVVI